MRASELRPGQHQYFLNWRGERCLFVRHRGPFDNDPKSGFVVYVKEIGDSFVIETQDWDRDVTPLNVHGWDDEPQSDKPSPPVEPEQFKAGDWVVCVDGNCDVVTGSVYRAASIDSDDLIYVGVKRDGYFRRRFRRATPAEVAEARDIDGEPLKVGDRVMCIACETRSDCRAHFDSGCEYEVTAIGEGWIAVGGSDDNQPGWCPLYFRKVQPAPITHWVEVVGR